MRKVVIAGVGMTNFGRFLHRSAKELVAEAATAMLDDAGTTPDQVRMAFFSNVLAGIMQGQESSRGQVWLERSGLQGVPTVNVENACASGSSALHLAWLSVASGHVDVAVAVGVEKMYDENRTKIFSAFESAADQERLADLRESLGADQGPPRSLFMDVYADFARRYTERTGATAEDFARVAVKNHYHGSLNPKAQYRQRYSVEEVLAARPITGPLTLPMCAPIGDGAAAVLVTTEDLAGRWDAEPIRVLGTAIGGGEVGAYGTLVPETARRAFEQAGVGPEDLDVVECHDAAAPAELIVMEELGIAAPGEAAGRLAAGDTALGGRLPINPSGGLVSKGHPLGATGLAQIVELVEQLRGRAGQRQVPGARIGLAENAGGYLGPDAAAATVTILARP